MTGENINLETVNIVDIPYGMTRVRDDFFAVYKNSRLLDRGWIQLPTSLDAAPFIPSVSHPLVPFTVRVGGDGVGIMVYFTGAGWEYKLAYLDALFSGVPAAPTHKYARGDMDKMIEDLIAAKLAL